VLFPFYGLTETDSTYIQKSKKIKSQRKSIRLKEFDYTTPWWYYITICMFNHKILFGEIKKGKLVLNDFGKIVKDEWLKTKTIRNNIDLDYYVIMPNHFHGILINESRDKARLVPTEVRRFGKPVPNSLSSIIGSFKSAVTKRINESRKSPGAKVWQSRFYDHIIRNDNDLHRIRTYIQNNPLKWELDEYYKENL